MGYIPTLRVIFAVTTAGANMIFSKLKVIKIGCWIKYVKYFFFSLSYHKKLKNFQNNFHIITIYLVVYFKYLDTLQKL